MQSMEASTVHRSVPRQLQLGTVCFASGATLWFVVRQTLTILLALDRRFRALSAIGVPLHVCADCVIGFIVPAFRTAISRWNFGRVVAYEHPYFAVFFDGGSRPEWVQLESKPMEAYLHQYRAKRLSTRVPEPKESIHFPTGNHPPPPQQPLAWWTRPPPVSPYDSHWRHPFVRRPSTLSGTMRPTGTIDSPLHTDNSDEEDLDGGGEFRAIKVAQKSSPRLWTSEERNNKQTTKHNANKKNTQ